MTLIAALIATSCGSDSSKIEAAKLQIEAGEYSAAITSLENISDESEYYLIADSLIKYANEQLKIAEEEKRIAELKEQEEKIKEERNQQIEQFKREIKSIDNGIDFSNYRGTVESLQMEIVLFGTWANIIIKGLDSNDNQIKNLASRLKSRVVRLQIQQFPILRNEYAKIVARLMWENDIEVYANGTGYRYINFVGAIFAANKNKQDFQNEVHEVLKMFRYTQSRYRWYKEADEYTYWTIYEGKDSDLVTLK